MTTRRSLEERFWEKVNKDGPTIRPDLGQCWVWIAGTFDNGYGAFQKDGHPQRAHRVGWELQEGSIPDGQDVLHHCDNNPCVRRSHLFLGTDVENAQDRVRRGRSASGDRHKSRTQPESVPRGSDHWAARNPEQTVRGEAHGRAKLDETMVKDIRRRYSEGETQKALAQEFGVSAQNVHDIVNRKIWTHV